MMSDTRKTVLITGCSSGAGLALAKEFNSRGWRVFATARSKDKLAELSPLGIEPLEVEVHLPESVKRLHDEVTRLTNGKLDMLINNAGRNQTVPAVHIDQEEVRYTFATNVFGVMDMCSTFTPLLVPTRGIIVQIGSIAAIMPYAFGSAYNASKAALHAYSNTLRVELAPFGVRVLTIITGGVQSNIARVERELPEDSIYLPVSEDYQRRLKHSQESGSMPAAAYARSVADAATRRHPRRWHWEGNKSWVIWFASTFLPHGLMDYVFARMFNFWKLRGSYKNKGD